MDNVNKLKNNIFSILMCATETECAVSVDDISDALTLIELQQQTITDLCNALNNVLSHTNTDTIAEAVAVLERVRGGAK